MSSPYHNPVIRGEREGGAWRLYLTCGHSVYSAVAPEQVTGPAFCAHCYVAAGRRRQEVEDRELAALSAMMVALHGD